MEGFLGWEKHQTKYIGMTPAMFNRLLTLGILEV
jgi:hypothetical protein